MTLKLPKLCCGSIGLPKKRAVSKPIAFAQKHYKIKENIIME